MTGCPNGCARPYNADIGLVGRSATRNDDGTPGPGTYTIFLGGRTVGDRLNVEFKDYVPFDKVVPELVPVLARYKAETARRRDLRRLLPPGRRRRPGRRGEPGLRRKVGGSASHLPDLTIFEPLHRGDPGGGEEIKAITIQDRPDPRRPPPMIPVLREAGLSELLDGDSVETVAHEGLEFTEGPLWLPDGSLLFQDIKAEKTYKVDPGWGSLGDRPPVRHPRRQRPDLRRRGAGRLLRAERPAGLADEPDGSGVETVVEAWEGKRLNSPNDIVARVRWPGLLHRPPLWGEAPSRPRSSTFQGVFALDGLGDPPADPRRLREAQRPGAFLPTRRRSTSATPPSYHVRAFGDREIREPWSSARAGSSATLDPGQPGGPDGLKVDSRRPGLRRRRPGRLGLRARRHPPGNPLASPRGPSNLNWGTPDGKTLASSPRSTTSTRSGSRSPA